MTETRELAPGEWSVLALLAEGPQHGWAIAKVMSASGEIGRVWSVGRPLVYRAMELLESRRLIEPAGREPGARGPNRVLYRATELGREQVAGWLREPVVRVRDIRSLFLLKLVLIERSGLPATTLLEAQRTVVAPAVEELAARLRSSAGSERVSVRFRLETTRAAVEFIDGLLAEEARGASGLCPEPA